MVTAGGGVTGGGDVCVDGVPAYPQPIAAIATKAVATTNESFLRAA
jgi:hypothetical protein